VAMGLRLVMQSAVASAPSKCYREENAIGLSLCLAGDVPAPTSLQQRPVGPHAPLPDLALADMVCALSGRCKRRTV